MCILIILAVSMGCGKPQVITIHDLINNQSKYNNQLVIVEGCYKTSFEEIYFYPCEKEIDSWADVISIDQYDSFEWDEENIIGYKANIIKRDSSPSVREREIINEIRTMSKSNPVKVILEGQFQFSTTPDYGHNQPLKYRIIVHHYFSVSPNITPHL